MTRVRGPAISVRPLCLTAFVCRILTTGLPHCVCRVVAAALPVASVCTLSDCTSFAALPTRCSTSFFYNFPCRHSLPARDERCPSPFHAPFFVDPLIGTLCRRSLTTGPSSAPLPLFLLIRPLADHMGLARYRSLPCSSQPLVLFDSPSVARSAACTRPLFRSVSCPQPSDRRSIRTRSFRLKLKRGNEILGLVLYLCTSERNER